MIATKLVRVAAVALVACGVPLVLRVAHEPANPPISGPIFAADRDAAAEKTEVEPDSASWGNKIVATYQAVRYFTGGSVGFRWATSADRGRHWRSGTLPLGGYERASDAVVTFDAAHHVWLIAGIGFRGPAHEIFVSRSRDGYTWSRPIVAAADLDEDRDKEWITCDNAAFSPHRGRCYLAYVDVLRWQLGTRMSDDGGQTWSNVQRLQPGVTGSTFSGPIPVTRPNGDLVIPYSFWAPIDGEDRVAAVVSHDGGATFSQPVRIAALEAAEVSDMLRAPALPTVAVDADGKLYVAWEDGRFRDTGDENDIVVSASADGTSWTEPVRIPLARARTYFVPAIAVDPSTSGETAHVAVAYYSMHMTRDCTTFYVPGCFQQIDAWLVESRNGGRSWGVPRRLNTKPMQLAWLADTTLGAMLGDYISVSYVRGRPVPVLALAAPPTAAGLSESIVACPPGKGSTCRRLSP